MKQPITTEHSQGSRFGTKGLWWWMKRRWTAKRPLGSGPHAHAWTVSYGMTKRSAIRNLKKLEGGAK